MPNLILGNTDILNAITDLQKKSTTIDSNTDLIVNSIQSEGLVLKALSDIDQSMTIHAGGESRNAILYFSTP